LPRRRRRSGPRLGRAAQSVAPGAPGALPSWSSAAKTGAGASYEAYVDGQYRDGGQTGAVSKVWFSIADGVLTETMYGLIHEAQIKALRFAVVTPDGLASKATTPRPRPNICTSTPRGARCRRPTRSRRSDKAGRFEIEKRIFTDPDRNALVLRVTITALKGDVTPYLMLEPHIANTGVDDRGAGHARRLPRLGGRHPPVPEAQRGLRRPASASSAPRTA
jgi:glucoamylase